MAEARKAIEALVIPDLNEKFINNLSTQLESLFSQANEEEPGLHSARSLRSGRLGDEEEEALGEDERPASVEEKEKILETVKTSALQMQSELVELMKTEYEKRIQEIEREKARLDAER